MASLQEYFAALTPARDRRVEPRTTPTSLSYVALGAGDGIILNISETGMAVAVAHHLVIGEHLRCIRLLLPSFNQSIEISAQVVWLSESRKGAGIRFVQPSEEFRDHIANWIASERTTPELEHLPKLPRRDTEPVEISSGKARTVFSNKLISGAEAGMRYADMFPSESAISNIVTTVDEIKRDQAPPPASRIRSDAGDSVTGSSVEVAVADIPQSRGALRSEGNRKFASGSIEVSRRNLNEVLASDSVHGSRIQTEIPPSRPDLSPSQLNLPDKSAERGFKFQFAALASLLVAVSFILGLTAGYAPIGKRLRNARKSGPPVAVPSMPSDALGEVTSTTPNANTPETPSSETSAVDTEESRPKIPASSRSRSRDSDARPKESKPSLPFSPLASRRKAASGKSPDKRKLDAAPPVEENSNKMATVTDPSANVPSKEPNPSSTLESKSLVDSEKRTDEPGDSTGEATGTSAPTATPKRESVHPPTVTGSTSNAPRELGPRSVARAANVVPHAIPGPENVSIPATEYGKLVRAVFPKKSIADSPSIAITSQLSVLISPMSRSSSGDHQTARLQAGDLVSFAEPRLPRQDDRYKSTETVKVRATIGTRGQVTDVRPVTGPIFLLSSVITAVRQWHFHPTLLNDMPVQSQQDVTIEFRLQR
jgi:hypothetical protein